MKPIREIKLSNSLTGKKETLQTLTPGKLTMYTCGPTVYNFIHIGNLRGALVADMVARYFRRVGYDVTYVRNYTDVDDRIIQQSREEGIPSIQVSEKYIREVEKDYAVAGLIEPDHKTKVTDHMPEIIDMIGKIVANGKGYVVPSDSGKPDEGEVLFSIESFPTYGKLSHKNIEDLIAGHRVEVSQKKRSPLDFTLWKPAKPGEPEWESPWGKGRPGWHIECSAMAAKWLGNRIDVHHGGEDLVFPHHENEIAQSEAASGDAPFVSYWLHHAFLNLSKQKMSKSLGNVFTARAFLTEYSGEFARYMLLGVHYRSPIEFGEDTVDQAWTSLHRIYETKAKALELTRQARARADLRAEAAWGSFAASCGEASQAIDGHYANDFNTSGALGELFTLIREFNRTLAEPLAAATPSAVLGAQQLIKIMEDDIGSVIGVGRLDPSKALEDLARIKDRKTIAAGGSARPTDEEILAAIEARKAARAAKDFAKADQIRKDLEARGVVLKDAAGGTTWDLK